MNSPSINCACTEAPSNKDWWQLPELSVSQSNMAALGQEEAACEQRQGGKKREKRSGDVPERPAAAVLPGSHVTRSGQGEDALPGS